VISRFLRSQPRRLGLGQRSGATLTEDRKKNYNKASDVASNKSASSTICGLRAAAIREAVGASMFTLRGTPFVA
jgi:hypothetical protein